MTFTHVKQPDNHSCAAACVSILTGAPITEVIAELRPTPKRGTQHARIFAALRARGISCGKQFTSVIGKALPRTAIVRITYPNKRGHVVVKHERTWFDPLLDKPFTGMPTLEAKAMTWSNGGRITSFLWVVAP